MAQPRQLRPPPSIPLDLRRAARAERAEFRHLYAVLLAAFDLGKPEARRQAKDARAAYAELAVQLRHIKRPSRRQRLTLALLDERVAKLGDLLNRTRKKKPRSHDAGPTPETVAQSERAQALGGAEARREGFRRLRGDSLARLRANGVIDRDHERAGREIARIFEAVTRGLFAKASSLEKGFGGRPGDRMSARLAVLHVERYRPWAEAVLGNALLGAQGMALALAVAVDGESLKRAARRSSIGYTRAQGIVRSALEIYARRTRATRWAEDADHVTSRIEAEERALAEP